MVDTFPGASEQELADAAYGIVGAPLDASTSFYPGTRFGPERIRHFAQGFEDYDQQTERRFSDLGVADTGNVRPWSDVDAYLEFLTGELRDVRDAGAVPILLGGEHTISVAGVRATMADHVVCIDAHLDLRERFDGDEWSHATATHHLLSETDCVTILGARAGSEAEWERAARDAAVETVPPTDVQSWLDVPATDRFDDAGVYLNIDIDGIDPAFAPATGTREPFGLSPRIVKEIVHDVAPRAIGFDIVEVNDRDEGETATLAAKLVKEFVFQHADQS